MRLDVYHISYLGMQSHTICLAFYEDLQMQPKEKLWG